MKRWLVHLLIAFAMIMVYRAVILVVDEYLRDDETLLT